VDWELLAVVGRFATSSRKLCPILAHRMNPPPEFCHSCKLRTRKNACGRRHAQQKKGMHWWSNLARPQYRRPAPPARPPYPECGRNSEPTRHEQDQRPGTQPRRRSEFRKSGFRLLREARPRRLREWSASAHVRPDQRRLDRVLGRTSATV